MAPQLSRSRLRATVPTRTASNLLLIPILSQHLTVSLNISQSPQVLKVAPKLQGFVTDLCGRLVGRQIWSDASQWQGFLLWGRNTAPASYPVLLQLPPATLDAALARLPPAFGAALAKYAGSAACKMQVTLESSLPTSPRARQHHHPVSYKSLLDG